MLVVGCGESSIHDGASGGNIDAVKKHLAAGADVNAKRGDGQTPLHHALVNSPKVASLLIAAGADVNAKDGLGWTPLHHVTSLTFEDLVRCDSQLTVEQLIVKGADVNLMNEDQETPLDLLSSDELKGVTANIAILLRKHGAKTGEELKAEGK